MFKKILLVRNEETFMVNAIKNLLKSKNYIVEDSSYSVGELNNKKQGVNLAILYTDEDIESHRDAMGVEFYSNESQITDTAVNLFIQL